MAAATNVFHVVKAASLDPLRDVYIGLPVEGNSKQAFHRVPVRSSVLQNPLARVQMLPGQTHVVQSTQGLRRLLLEFPQAYAPGIRVYTQDSADGDRSNVSLGFALFDHRAGPSPEEVQVQTNIDALAALVRRQLMQCDKIRCTLKLGPAKMEPRDQEVAADMLDLHVARPASVGTDGNSRRYLYTKVVLPSSNAPEMFHTYFWTPDGQRLPYDVVQRYQNFQVVPFVEVEDVFVNKAMRSLQLKLRECIVYPPAERLNTRVSVCFPGRVCSADAAAGSNEPPAPTIQPESIVDPHPEEQAAPVVPVTTHQQEEQEESRDSDPHRPEDTTAEDAEEMTMTSSPGDDVGAPQQQVSSTNRGSKRARRVDPAGDRAATKAPKTSDL